MRVGPGKSTRSKRANEPNAPKRLTCGFENSTWVRAKTVGMMTAALIDRLTARRSGSFLPTHRPNADHGGVVGAAPLGLGRGVRGGRRELPICGRLWGHLPFEASPPYAPRSTGCPGASPVSLCCQSVLTGTASWPLSHGRPAAATSSHFDRSTDSPWPRSAGEGPIRSTSGWSRSASKP